MKESSLSLVALTESVDFHASIFNIRTLKFFRVFPFIKEIIINPPSVAGYAFDGCIEKKLSYKISLVACA